MAEYCFTREDIAISDSNMALVALTNPADSERLIVIEKILIHSFTRSFAEGAQCPVGARYVMPGGQTASPKTSYGRLDTSAPEPRGEIFESVLGGTLLGKIIAVAPPISADGIGAYASSQQEFLSRDYPIILQEGETFAIQHQGSQAESNIYNIAIYWSEKLGQTKYDDVARARG